MLRKIIDTSAIKKNIKPSVNKLYEGYVLRVLRPSNTVIVLLPEFGENFTVTCNYASAIISGLLGFNINWLPPSGTKVSVILTEANTGYITQCYSGVSELTPEFQRKIEDANNTNFENIKIFDEANEKDVAYCDSFMPIDLTEGEIDISSATGTAIRLLNSLVSMEASELAKVQASMIDDTVKIVSDTFKHMTCFGDYKIFNDHGRLNVRWDGTSKEFEAMGALEEKGKPFEKDLDLPKKDELFIKTGRWRFSMFLGHIGDFFNLFITEPTKTLGKIAEDSIRSGRFRAHVNMDGSFLLQSIGDIAMERVCRITVPIEQKREHDPEGDGKEMDDQIKEWNTKEESVLHTAYKLRDYAKWFSNVYSMAKYHAHKKDFRIPNETEFENEDVDNKDIKFTDVYATVRIFKNGDILILNGSNTSVLLNGQNAVISAPGSITLESGKNINMIAGGNINLKANGNYELFSNGSISASCDKSIQLNSRNDGILIQADGDKTISQKNNRKVEGIVLKSKANIIFQATEQCISIAKTIFSKFTNLLNINNKVNIDDKGNISVSGNVAAMGNVSGASVIGSLMNTTPIISHGNVHVSSGSAVPVNIRNNNYNQSEADFSYSEHNQEELFESLSQQYLKISKENKREWDFSKDSDVFRGSPWPGIRIPEHKEYDPVFKDIDKPAENNEFSNNPAEMQIKPIKFKIPD